MSYDGDASQSSDLSGISRISRPSGKLDSSWNISECQASSTFREPIGGLTVNGPIGTTSKVSRIIKLIDSCENAISNRAKLRLLYDCVEEIAENDNELTRSTISKLKTILINNDLGKYLQLPNGEKKNHGVLNILGISDLPKCHLTDAEKREINTRVNSVFEKKIDHFTERYENLGGKLSEIAKSQESAGKTILMESHETNLMRWNDSMNELCAEYHRDLGACVDLLRQWQRLKYTEMRELNVKNAENLLLRAEIAEVQGKISTRTCASRMFNEAPFTVKAHEILKDDLDARILEFRERIKKKEILKMKYADASSTEYDQLLNRYTELCTVIKKKERLMELL